MQLCEAHEQKKSLFTAMSRFIGAVNDMQQTVKVPSLLRDVPLEDGDMYGSYVLLTSIRDHVEWGGVQRDGRAEEEELEKRFHFHLNGLHGVLSQLTRRANTLTRRYKQELGL